MKGQDTYKEIVTFTFPNMLARVHIPDLTETERKRRLKIIHDAAVNLIKNQV